MFRTIYPYIKVGGCENTIIVGGRVKDTIVGHDQESLVKWWDNEIFVGREGGGILTWLKEGRRKSLIKKGE